MSRPNVIVVRDIWSALNIARPIGTIRLGSPTETARPWRWSLLAIVLTVVLHVLLGAVMFTPFGGTVANPQVVRESFASSTQNDDGGIVTTLILLSDTQTATPDIKLHDVVPGQSPETATVLPIEIIDAPMPNLTEVTGAENIHLSALAGEGTKPKTPEGIYRNQIYARIARAWDEPQGMRLAVGSCEVNVKQDTQGVVQQIHFGQCVATDSWKASLAKAIYYASPLPAPPEERVFTETVTLLF